MRKRILDPKKKLFETIDYTGTQALLRKLDTKDLYIVTLEDVTLQDWLEIYSEDDTSYYEPLEDILTDAWNGDFMPTYPKIKSNNNPPEKIEPLTRDSFGTGLESYSPYLLQDDPDYPGETITPEPDVYKPFVKVDLPLARRLEREFEERAYNRHYTNARGIPIRLSGNRTYLEFLKELYRKFPQL